MDSSFWTPSTTPASSTAAALVSATAFFNSAFFSFNSAFCFFNSAFFSALAAFCWALVSEIFVLTFSVVFVTVSTTWSLFSATFFVTNLAHFFDKFETFSDKQPTIVCEPKIISGHTAVISDLSQASSNVFGSDFTNPNFSNNPAFAAVVTVVSINPSVKIFFIFFPFLLFLCPNDRNFSTVSSIFY